MTKFLENDNVYVEADIVTNFTVKGSFSHNAPSDLDYYGYSEFEVDNLRVVNEDTGEVNNPADVFWILESINPKFPGDKEQGKIWDNMVAHYEIEYVEDEHGMIQCTKINLDRALAAMHEIIEADGHPEEEPDYPDVPDYD